MIPKNINIHKDTTNCFLSLFPPEDLLDIQVTTTADVCDSLCGYTFRCSKGWSLAPWPRGAGSDGDIITQI